MDNDQDLVVEQPTTARAAGLDSRGPPSRGRAALRGRELVGQVCGAQHLQHAAVHAVCHRTVEVTVLPLRVAVMVGS
jgi:hypothetical protein